MKVLFQMKADRSFQGFVSTSYIGELVGEVGSKINVERTCAVYEVINQQKTGFDLGIKYYSNSMLTNGIVEFAKEDVVFWREVSEGDEILIGYEEALKSLELHQVKVRSGLILEGKG